MAFPCRVLPRLSAITDRRPDATPRFRPPIFDPVGGFRERYRSNVGSDELSGLLAADPEPLARAFVAHLSRFATGAEVSYADRSEIARIVEGAKEQGESLRSLMHGLAQSRMFGD